MFKVRKSQDRGQGNYDWLKAKYTFSFASYQDHEFTGLSNFIVMNEDKIAGGKGFAPHSHKDMEIITYMIEGAVEHEDSMGNKGVIRPGDIQYMSAGTGVTHSEYNHLKAEEAHLLQVWIKPDGLGHAPNYGQDSYLARLEKNRPCLLVSPDGKNDSIKIHQNALIYTAKYDQGQNLEYQFQFKNGWVQIVKGALRVNEIDLSSGDGLAITDEPNISIYANENSEFLLFDLA